MLHLVGLFSERTPVGRRSTQTLNQRELCTTFEVFTVTMVDALIFSSMITFSLVICYHILGGTCCVKVKAEGSFRCSQPATKLDGVITHTNIVLVFIVKKSQTSSKKSQFTDLITLQNKHKSYTTILTQVLLVS